MHRVGEHLRKVASLSEMLTHKEFLHCCQAFYYDDSGCKHMERLKGKVAWGLVASGQNETFLVILIPVKVKAIV